MEYKNFRVRIEAAPSGGFRISGESDFGEETETFRVPFPRRRIENLPLLFERLRKAQQEEQELRPTAEEIGDELFRSLFSGKVGKLFQKTRVRLEAQGLGQAMAFESSSISISTTPASFPSRRCPGSCCGTAPGTDSSL